MKIFQNVADLSAASLTANQLVETKGYTTAGDGGQARYLIKTAADFGATPDGYGDFTLANSNVAVLQTEGSVNVKQYGATGGGVTDDTAAIQAAIDAAASLGASITLPAGNYSVSFVTLKDGLLGFLGHDATITGQGSTGTSGVVRLGDGVTPLGRNCLVTVRMDMSNGDRVAIGGEANDCIFDSCRIFGFTDDATLNHYGILLNKGSSRNRITNNNIVGFPSPTQRGLLIDLIGDGLADYGGFFTGTIVRAIWPCVGNIIANNVLTFGSYAVNLLGAEKTIVDGNYCHSQNHRSIYSAVASWDNIISNNECIEYLSSGIVLGYGSSNTVVSGNKFLREVYTGGEAAININTGSSNNLITDNHIRAGANYGVYIATDSSFNKVKNNYIEWFYLSGVGVDNDYVTPKPANAIYSRPNYAPPTDLNPSFTAWSFNNLIGTVIEGNSFGDGYTGRPTAAISLAQIDGLGATGLHQTVVSNNNILSTTNMTYNLHIYSDTDSKFDDLKIMGNNFLSTNTSKSANTSGVTTWRPKLSYFGGNSEFDSLVMAERIVFAADDATPSVSAALNSNSDQNLFSFEAYTVSTNVTDFDDGYIGQTIVLKLSQFVTIKYNSGLIRTKGSVDVAGGSSNNFIAFHNQFGTWFEIWRSF